MIENKHEQPSPSTILIVSTKFDPHVDVLIRPLTERHIPFIRFNTEDFPLRSLLSISLEGLDLQTKLQVPNNPEAYISDIASVWYRRPAPFEFPSQFSPQAYVLAERETTAAIRGLWSLLNCKWVNHPEKNRVAENKLRQLQEAQRVGLEIPKTLLTNDSKSVEKFVNETQGNVIIKSLSGGLVPDDVDSQVIFTNVVSKENFQDIETVRYCPTLFQQYIPKSIEIRTTVVGNKAFSAEIHSQALETTKHDWRRDALRLKHREHQLPRKVESKCLTLVHSFGLHFGTIDLILTPDNHYIFLELNPNGQWAWVEDLTGLPITEAMIDLLTH